MALSLDDIAQLLSTCGVRQYGGEAVSQLEHALQCAQLAEQAGDTPAAVAAALLHDLGHLLVSFNCDSAAQDEMHQYMVVPFLRGLLPDAVLEPIRLHVDAKRWLCTTTPGYAAALSPASQHSLALQGGPFSPAEAQRFVQQPFAQQAITLRRRDDLAKVPGLPTPGLEHYLAVLAAVAGAAVGSAPRQPGNTQSDAGAAPIGVHSSTSASLQSAT